MSWVCYSSNQNILASSGLDCWEFWRFLAGQQRSLGHFVCFPWILLQMEVIHLGTCCLLILIKITRKNNLCCKLFNHCLFAVIIEIIHRETYVECTMASLQIEQIGKFFGSLVWVAARVLLISSSALVPFCRVFEWCTQDIFAQITPCTNPALLYCFCAKSFC